MNTKAKKETALDVWREMQAAAQILYAASLRESDSGIMEDMQAHAHEITSWARRLRRAREARAACMMICAREAVDLAVDEIAAQHPDMIAAATNALDACRDALHGIIEGGAK